MAKLELVKKCWRKFLYLGYDRQVIQGIRSKLNEDNLRVVESVSLVLIFILGILLGFYSLFDSNPVRNWICILSLFIMLGTFTISRRMRRKKMPTSDGNVNLLIDVLSFICFLVAIYLGTFAAGDEMAVAPVWMFFFASLIFNRLPGQNLFVMLVSMAAFVVCSALTKRPHVFQYDMMHAATSIFASMCVSWDKTRVKIAYILSLDQMKNTNMEIMETVEEQEREAMLLRQKASRDELTGFYKKTIFEEGVKACLDSGDEQTKFSMFCIDVDNFKGINDHMGHLFGDNVLKQMGRIMEETVDENALLCRFGGDEFCLFLTNIDGKEEAERLARRIVQRGEKQFEKDGVLQRTSLSVGVAVAEGKGLVYRDLFQRADEALYRAKKAGKNTYYMDQTTP